MVIGDGAWYSQVIVCAVYLTTRMNVEGDPGGKEK